MSRTSHRRPCRRPDRAVVERYRPMRIYDMLTNERARLPCGCCMYVGITLDGGRPTTGARPCSETHVRITERATGLLAQEIAHPTGRKLIVDRCQQFLSQAARELL